MADKNEENAEDEDLIKSSCLIKFQQHEKLPTFSTLQCSLDLRRPPSNWLNGQIKIKPSSTSYKFSSFKMALDFFDEIGDVDVISDSENIKNLLKIAYNPNGVLSFFVHRVGNTLLIDEFNLHRYLMWKSEDDWTWLRSFIYENVLNRETPIPIQHKTKEFLEQKNLLSKFLYYSIEDSKKAEQKEFHPCLSFNNALLPQPKREDIPDNHQYSRNILWNFEDIRMLIGSDMQIFGNQTRPCISLRLKDMKEPINVLTGIDYWLDNLMCNVPEIFMCYHLNGIVQKYELIKTEDLPNMENSKFSPKVIRNISQNILSFLKQNATKAGHTYWLFKAKNDDVVKLYDLTTLQLITDEKEKQKENPKQESEDKKDQNPFVVPVGILLYTVARNMKYSNEKLTTKQAGNIKQLLDNCLKLLPKEKYPQIITTSHYILSDIQIQAGTDPQNPESPFEDETTDSDENSEEYDYDGPESEDDLDFKDECYPAIQSLKDAINDSSSSSENNNHKNYNAAPLILGNIQERSEESLKNIISGLECLKFFECDASLAQKQREQIIHEEQNPNLLQNPDQAIPMGWDEDDKKSKASSKRGDSPTESDGNTTANDLQFDSKSLLMRGSPNVKTWNIHLKVLLFEKASLTYACMAENFYNSKQYGAALKNLRYSILCQAVVGQAVPTMRTQRSVLYGRAGDCYFQINKSFSNIQKYIDGFNNESDHDRDICRELDKENLNCDEDEIIAPYESEEKVLEISCKCYEIGLLDTTQSRFELVRRLGNVYNELGVALMHKAQNLYNVHVEEQNGSKEENDVEISTKELSYQQVAKSSYDYLLKAVALFEGVQDSINLIICHLNLGRFFRLSAHINIFHDFNLSKTPQMQKKLYQQSFDSYKRALAILENRKQNPELWDMVSWELSTATFNLVKQMQDNGTCDGNKEELEKEVLEMLMKALKLCDTETNSSRQVLYIFRAGLIHQRIASFYHQILRSGPEENKKKTMLQLCRLNYEKAANFLSSLHEFKDYFKVQMEKVALQEFLTEESTYSPQKMKNLQMALQYFMESQKMLKSLSQVKSILEADEVLALLELFEKRLQFILKSLTKLSTSGKKHDVKAESYKKMFACTLRNNQKLQLKELVGHLNIVLDKLQQFEAI